MLRSLIVFLAVLGSFSPVLVDPGSLPIGSQIIYAGITTCRPADICTVTGANFSSSPSVYVQNSQTGAQIYAWVLHGENNEVTFQIDPRSTPAALNIAVYGAGTRSPYFQANTPQIWFWEYPEFQSGDQVRIFGKDFSIAGSKPSVTLIDNLSNQLPATVTAFDDRSITLITPPGIVSGRTYTASVNNAYGMGAGTDTATGRATACAGYDPFNLDAPWSCDYAQTAYNAVTSSQFAHADPTGATFSNTALNAGISYISSHGGGILFLPPGTYSLDPSPSIAITMQSNVVIEGAGPSQTTITYGPSVNEGNGYAQFVIWFNTGANNSGFTNLTLTDIDTLSQAVVPLVVQGSSAKVFFSNVVWHNGTGQTIQPNHLDRAVFINCQFFAAINNQSPNSTYPQNAGTGLFFMFAAAGSQPASTNFYFKNNIVNWYSGGNLFGSAARMIMEGNTFTRNLDQVLVASANLPWINGNDQDPMNLGDIGQRQMGRQIAIDFAQQFVVQNNQFLVGLGGQLRYNLNDGETINSEAGASTSFNSLGTITSATSNSLTGSIVGGTWSTAITPGYSVVAIVNGAGVGQWATVSAFNSGTGVVTLVSTLAIVPSVGDMFIILNPSQYGIIRNNFASGNPSGILLYRGGYLNVAVDGNMLLDNAGIAGVGLQNTTAPTLGLSRGVEIVNNSIIDFRAIAPAWIAFNAPIDNPNSICCRFLDSFVARNNVLQGNPNMPFDIFNEGISAALGYFSSSRYSPANDLVPSILGPVFQSNWVSNISAPYQLSTGVQAATIWSPIGQTTTKDSYLTSTATHGSISTVVGWDGSSFAGLPANEGAPQILNPQSPHGLPSRPLGGSMSLPQPQCGQPIAATVGKWRGNPTSFQVQWYRGGNVIAGANSLVYVPAPSDAGYALSVSLSASNAAGRTQLVSSAATLPVLPASTSAPQCQALPQIGSSPTAGKAEPVLSLGWFTGAPSSYACQWMRNGVTIGGATNCVSYVPQRADLRNALALSVAPLNGAGAGTACQSRSFVVR